MVDSWVRLSGRDARVVLVRVVGEDVHQRPVAPALPVRGPHVAQEGGRRMRVPRQLGPVAAPGGEGAAEHVDVFGHGLERVVALAEEQLVVARGDVLAVRPELRHPETVDVRLVSDDEVPHRQAARERGGVGGEVAPLLGGVGRGRAAGLVDGDEEAHVGVPRRLGDVAQSRELAAASARSRPAPRSTRCGSRRTPRRGPPRPVRGPRRAREASSRPRPPRRGTRIPRPRRRRRRRRRCSR